MVRYMLLGEGHSTLSRFGLVTLLASVLLAGCGSHHVAEHVTTTTTVLSTTSTVPSEDAAVLNDYRQFWASYEAAADPMNPGDPRLAQYATGQELSQLHSAFLRESAGEVLRGSIDLAPKVIAIQGNQATVEDCYLDHGQVVDAKTGTPQGTQDTERQLIDATMQLEDGGWKIAAIDHKGSGCTASP